LKNEISSEAPQEIFALKEKIFTGRYEGKSGKKGPVTYIILFHFNNQTKKIKYLYVSDNEGTSSKPTKAIVEGTYTGIENNPLKYASDNSGKPWVEFSILNSDKGTQIKFHYLRSNSDVLFQPIAEFNF